MMMMLKLPNRSQRAKGLRAKRVFQACLVLALCIWLLYQVKHSYEGNKEYVKANEEALEVMMLHENNAVKLGRKNLDPQENSRFEGQGIGSAKEMVKQEKADDEGKEDGDQERPEDEETEQLREDVIDEDDTEKENEIEDTGTPALDDQFGDEGERNFPDAWEENYKNEDASGSVED